jgi:hypothetical protein
MRKISEFLNQSAFEPNSHAGAFAPEFRGSFAERFGIPLMLGAFAYLWIAVLASQV